MPRLQVQGFYKEESLWEKMEHKPGRLEGHQSDLTWREGEKIGQQCPNGRRKVWQGHQGILKPKLTNRRIPCPSRKKPTLETLPHAIACKWPLGGKALGQMWRWISEPSTWGLSQLCSRQFFKAHSHSLHRVFFKGDMSLFILPVYHFVSIAVSRDENIKGQDQNKPVSVTGLVINFTSHHQSIT